MNRQEMDLFVDDFGFDNKYDEEGTSLTQSVCKAILDDIRRSTVERKDKQHETI